MPRLFTFVFAIYIYTCIVFECSLAQLASVKLHFAQSQLGDWRMHWLEKLYHCFIDFDDDDDANVDYVDDGAGDDDDDEVSEECSGSFLLFATKLF